MPSQKQVSFEYITSLVYERKFDTALRLTTTKEFMNRCITKTNTFDDNLILNSNKFINENLILSDSRLYSIILRDILNFSNNGQIYNPKYCHNLKRIPNIIKRVVNTQWDYINKHNYTLEQQNIRKLRNNWLSNIDLTCEILNLLTISNELNKIIIKVNKIKDKSYQKLPLDQRLEEKLKINHAAIKSLNMNIVWSDKLLYINYKDKNYIMPYSYLLLIYNKLNDLCSVLFYVLHSQDNALDKNAYSITIEFILCLINIHYEYKDNYFTLAKTLESLCVAETLCEIESWRNNHFLLSLSRELEDEIFFDYFNSELRLILCRVSTPLRHELCCLSKILGHPFVDMKEGSKDLFVKVQEPLTIDMIKVNESTNYIKQNYIRNHILRHGKWPPVSFESSSTPKALLMACLLNKDPHSFEIERQYGKVYIDQYSYINLLPNMRFSKLENYIPYLKDKTITLCRTKLFRSLWPNSYEQYKESWTETRLLLVYLLSSQLLLNHKQYIENYNDSTDLNELLDYLIIRIVPKEKELKVKFRGFGCKTFEDRARALAQEKSAMEFLDLYSDEQAMTLGELPLIKKLYSFRNILSSFKDHKVLYINLDASSWNNRFRSLTVDHTMRDTLDPIFNTSIFGKTHLAYEKTFVYVPDDKDTYYWNGQSGGIEGLNQDTWVITYLGQIKSAMKPLGYNYYVLCKGDDVRLAVLIPPIIVKDHSLENIKNLIVTHLQVSLKLFGHKIKIAESYGSEHYFTFSKTSSIDTIELPQVFRKIQKCHGANNAFISTLDEYIASAYSNAHSSCKVSPNVTPVYCVAVLWTLYDLFNHHKYKYLSDSELTALNLIPSIVGGFPIIYLHNMFVRAESDLLSPYIGLIQFTKYYDYELYTIMNNFLRFSPIKPASLISLYKDPYSLPLNRPVLPTTLLRTQIVPSLRKLTKNEGLKELFEYIDIGISDDILNCLQSSNIQNVKVFSNVYSATPLGLLDEILRKFETSRSVYELLILRGGDKLANKVMYRVFKAEARLQHWRVMRLRGLDHRDYEQYMIDETKCPAELSQRLRELLWGKKIEGITMPPLQHQISLMTPLQASQDEYAINNHFTYYCINDFKPSYIKNPTQHYLSSGKKPFLGYATRSGTIAPTVHFLEKDMILIKLKNILDLISWTSKTSIDIDGNIIESNFHQLLHYIIKLYSPEDISKLGPFSGKQKSGTVQHHMRSPSFKEAIVPNTLSNIYQQTVGITNSHLLFRRSKEHFKVNFLHIYCYVVSLMYQDLDFRQYRFGSDEIWAITNKCHYCMHPIQETPIICNINFLKTKVIRPLTLTNIGSITEKLLITSVKEFEKTGIKINEIPTEMDYNTACGGIMQEFIDQTYTTRMRLANRYNIMHMTEESRSLHVNLIPQGRSRDIGQTEIKNMTPELINMYLIPKIYYELITIFPNINLSNYTSLLSAIPGSEFPWFSLIDNIYKAGQLGRIITDIQYMSKIPASNCFDNPHRASYYIAISSFLIQESNPIYGTFVLLSNYQDSDILNHLKTYSSAILRRIIIKELFPQIIQAHKLQHLIHMKTTYIQCLAVLIMYCSRNLFDEEYHIEILSKIKDIRKGKVQLITSDLVPPFIIEYDNIHDLVANEDLKYLNWQMTVYNKWLWEEAYIYLKDNYDSTLLIFDSFCKHIMLNVVYTDLPTCISIVRSERPEDEILDNLVIYQNNIPQYIHDGKKPTLYYTSNRLLQLEYSISSLDEELFNPKSYDFTTDKVILQDCYIYRPYGGYTTSLNKIIEIFDLLALPSNLGTSLDIGCFGEGYGGILDLCSKMTYTSNFLYTTLPPNPEIETLPYIARKSISENGHHLEFAHHSIGLYDLSSNRTLEYFESLRYTYYLLICDAEVSDYLSTKRTYLLRNVVNFYIRNRTENGILILKMNICEGSNLHKVVGTLSQYCDYIYIYRCKSSNIGGEVYIIAYGGRYNYINNLEQDLILPNLITYNRIEKYRLFWYNEYLNILKLKYRTIQWNITSNVHRLKWTKFNFELSGFSKLCSICEFPFHNGLQNQISQLSHIKEQAELIYITYNKCPQYLYSLIHDMIEFETRIGVWDLNTRRHKTILSEKWLKQIGFLLIMDIIRKSEDHEPIQEQFVREMYIQQLQKLPARLNWYPTNGRTFLMNHDDNGFISHPYYNFITGCNVGLYMLAYMLCSK